MTRKGGAPRRSAVAAVCTARPVTRRIGLFLGGACISLRDARPRAGCVGVFLGLVGLTIGLGRGVGPGSDVT